MESGTPPEGLLTAGVFCDFTMPQWRLQSQGIDDLVAMRKAGHAGPSSVPRSPSSGHWTASTSTTAHSLGNCATRCGPVARAATTRIPPARLAGFSTADTEYALPRQLPFGGGGEEIPSRPLRSTRKAMPNPGDFLPSGNGFAFTNAWPSEPAVTLKTPFGPI